MTVEELEDILLKPTYTAKDIARLTGYKQSRVTEIMNELKINFKGAVAFRSNVITAQSYWKWQGTTLEEQRRLLGITKGYINEEKEKSV